MDILNCIIVEDEPVHSNRLKKLLSATDNRIKIMAICRSIEDALVKITEKQPHLLFLDIQLQGNARGGFELLQKIECPSFDVIFTTAYIDHNITEIRRCGLDYLPKPYIQSEFQDTLNKVWEKRVGNIGIAQLNSLLRNLATEQLDEQFVWLRLSKSSMPVKIKNLIYCMARDQYTNMYIKDEGTGTISEILTSTGIGAWEKDLSALKFCRIHDSYLINVRHILKVVLKTGTLYLKQVEKPLAISKTGKERLSAIMKAPFSAL